MENVYEIIAAGMIKKGVPAHCKGFVYLRDMIFLTLEDETTPYHMRLLYQNIAAAGKCKWKTCERDARYALKDLHICVCEFIIKSAYEIKSEYNLSFETDTGGNKYYLCGLLKK